MSNDQPSPYSNAAVEATVDHLRQRIRELDADIQVMRQGSDALARILGRDEGLPLALHIPSVRAIVAGLEETQRGRDALRDAARAVVEVFDSGCGYLYECDDDCDALATRFEQYSGLNYCDGHAPPGNDTKVVEFDHAPAWRRLRSLTLPTPHDCKGLACPCSHPTYAEVSAELDKAERQRDALTEAAREVVGMTDLASCQECSRVATVYVDGSGCYCDAHGEEFGDGRSKDMRNAHAWRRLCALVKP